MQLRDFVTRSLLEISAGVSDAQAAAPAGTIISPNLLGVDMAGAGFSLQARGTEGFRAVQFVEFDVAVTASRDEQGKAGIAVVAALLKLEAGRDTSTAAETVSRVRFKVPVILPELPLPAG